MKNNSKATMGEDEITRATLARFLIVVVIAFKEIFLKLLGIFLKKSLKKSLNFL
jgi:hypothetical protein